MCHRCNQTTYHTPCGCGETPCVEQTPCDCAVSNLNTKCLVYSGETLACTGIEQGTNFDDFLIALDAYICTAIEQLASSLTLINVGSGSRIYAGTDNIGRRKIRSIVESGNLLDIVENTDTISIGINEANLNAFIEANQKTYTALNVGSGATLLKNITTVGDVTTFNFKSVIIDSQSGLGESFVRDIQQNADDVTIRVKKLKSDTLTITSTDTEVSIEQPMTASIPALYVNNLYIPSEEEFIAGNTKGFGTLSRPFTDTVTAYIAGVPTITPNTSIQNALNMYVGTGTGGDGINPASRLNPKLSGQKIIVQNNNYFYTFPGDFNYTNLNIELQGDVVSTTTGYLVDMDDNTKFDAINANCKIILNEGSVLTIQGDGLNNSGNNLATTTFATGRICTISGSGLILSTVDDINKYLINSDITNSGNNNDGNLCFNISVNLRADFQGIYLVGGNGKVDFYGALISGTLTNQVDLNLKAYHQTGGLVRLFKGSSKDFSGALLTPRKSVVTFTPTGGFTPNYISQNIKYIGSAETLFKKLNNNNVGLEVTNSISYYGVNIDNIFDSTNLWSVRFTENTLGAGVIDTSIVDLTLGNSTSSINTIGNNLVENLVKYGTRALAEASLPIGSKFINTNSNNVNLNTWFIDITMQ